MRRGFFRMCDIRARLASMLTGSPAEAKAKPRIPGWKFVYAAALLVVIYLLVCVGSWFFGAHRCESVATELNNSVDTVNIDRELSWVPPGVVCVLSDDAGRVLKRDSLLWGSL